MVRQQFSKCLWFVIILLFISLTINVPAAQAATITVNSAADTAVAGDSYCTLREAIANANSPLIDTTGGDCAVGVAGLDTINFNVPGSGPHTIALGSALPAITDPIVIDGYTEPGASANTLAVGNDAVLKIELDGSGAPGAIGLTLDTGSDGSAIKGLAINDFDYGIATYSSNNFIEGNFIGTDVSGTSAEGNTYDGLYFGSPGTGNTVGGASPAARNIISGNDGNGIVFDQVSGNYVYGNYIGVDGGGDADFKNNLSGIYLIRAGSGNMIGGAGAGEGNLIRFNKLYGVNIQGSSGTIQGNTLTTNQKSGIFVQVDYGASTSPATAGDDILSQPAIGGGGANTIDGNCTAGVAGCAGILMLDTAASNAASLHTDNTIGTNNGANDVEQGWYGAVELIRSDVPIADAVTINSSNGGPAYNLTYSASCAGVLDNTIIHDDDDNIDCADVRTWTAFIEFVVDPGGTLTGYTPQNVSGVNYSFDGDAGTDPTNTGDGFNGEGITTGTFSRYQVMEVGLQASPYHPTTTADGNDGLCTLAHCTLREAILAANSALGAETINLSAEAFYNISIPGSDEDDGATGDLDISDALTISGGGSEYTFVEGNEIDRVFDINSDAAQVTIEAVTIRGGDSPATGGGIQTDGTTLTLTNVILTENHSDTSGGGLYVSNANAILDTVEILNNTADADGGGIGALGNTTVVTLSNVLVEDNYAGNNGGGLFADNFARYQVFTSTINLNQAYDDGGGAYIYNGSLLSIEQSAVTRNIAQNGAGINNAGGSGTPTVSLINSTVSSNQASSAGGGLRLINFGSTIHLTSTTVSSNSATIGGGLDNFDGDVTLINAIIANHSGNGGDCESYIPLTGNGHNLDSDGSCISDGVNNDITDAAPLLGALNFNGGNTETHAPLAGSPVLGNGTCAGVPAVDQRNQGRPQGDGCDIGSVESALLGADPYTVVNTNDSGPGSLRQAIIDANNDEGEVTITFDIPGPGPHTIQPLSPLPTLTNQISINGLSQPGASCDSWPPALMIELDGTTAGAAAGLALETYDSAIRGLVINRFSQHGIQLVSADYNQIECNFIGTNVGGTAALGNGQDGIYANGSTHNTIGGVTPDKRNLISGNVQNGVLLVYGSDYNTVQGNYIGTDFGGALDLGNGQHGINIDGSNNTLGGAAPGEANIIAFNNFVGVSVEAGLNNAIRANSIFNSGMLGIDLDFDGVTPNDIGDADTGANNRQNFPVLIRAVPDDGAIFVQGRLDSAANTTFQFDIFANDACDASGYGEGQVYLGAIAGTTDLSGTLIFSDVLSAAVPQGQYVSATATDPYGDTSEFSACMVTGPDNDAWPRALRLTPNNTAAVDQHLDQMGQSRWYKFQVQPNSRVTVTLTNLPANYDLTVYKDIAEAYEELTTMEDLVKVSAEFAPNAFAPNAFAPNAFAPNAFAPNAFAPNAFAPNAFAPNAFAPNAFAPNAFAPNAFAPDTFAPNAFAPNAFAPNAFAPNAFAPNAFAPNAFAPNAFASAQSRSLLAISAFNGTTSEGVVLNTWLNDGDFYLRVQGRNGVFNTNLPFHLEVTMEPGGCDALNPLPPTSLTATAGGYRAIILADLGRMSGTPQEQADLQARLATFAARSEVQGVVVDVGADARVAAANAQADIKVDCPYAKNLVAESIKMIVDAYWDQNPSLEYIVILGNDNVIPFFRYPDNTLLGNEEGYIVPVLDFTHSQSSLRLSNVLSQDAYGSRNDLSLKDRQFVLPELAVGRLVETEPEITGMLDAYLLTASGVVTTPESSMVSGYDFLEDAALAVQAELEAGAGQPADALIAPNNISPLDPRAWTADQLATLLLTNRHDVIFLAGHFSADGALAADFQTQLKTSDVVASPVNLTNSIIFSAGCHSGYNTVNEHGIPGATDVLDWAQAFARKRATFIGGTGYQYGHTDFLKYGERLYTLFSEELRAGNGPISVGQALVRAKQRYLAEAPQLHDLDEKTLLQATVFGLPMLSVDMSFGRAGVTPLSLDVSVIGSLNSFPIDPGATLGLEYFDLAVSPTLVEHTVPMTNVDDNSVVSATYYSGSNGIATNPMEPVLPLEIVNVSAPGTTMVATGFVSGTYADIPNILPLTGAPTTEIRGVHVPFLSDVFFPIKFFHANYFDLLTGGSNTYLMLTPAQHRSMSPGSPTNMLRLYNEVGLRLYYSNNITEYGGGSIPALSAAPTIATISAEPDGLGNVVFQLAVFGNPAAGIQEVWVTYTATSGPYYGSWQSLYLTQNGADSTLWEGTLPLNGTPSEDMRFIAQAVNGVGRVTMMTNGGAYYIPGVTFGDPDQQAPTTLILDPAPSTGAYGASETFSAVLTSNGTPLQGQVVTFGLGQQLRAAVTDSNGRATVTLPLISIHGQYQLSASFEGNSDYASSSDATPFEITKQPTNIVLQIESLPGQSSVLATLSDVAGRRLIEQSIFLIISGPNGEFSARIITNLIGQVILNDIPLPPGTYNVTAYFGGQVPLPGATVNVASGSYNPSTASAVLEILPATGNITIKKETKPGNRNGFEFGGDLGDFTLDDGQQTQFTGRPAGIYQVFERRASFPKDTWALLWVQCTDLDTNDKFFFSLDDPQNPIQVDAEKFTVNIPLAGEQNLFCLFHNEQVNYEIDEPVPALKDHRLFLPLVRR